LLMWMCWEWIFLFLFPIGIRRTLFFNKPLQLCRCKTVSHMYNSISNNFL
jgi:hypothetical protein